MRNDSWALWGLRTRALFDFGHPVAPVFTQSWYPALQYPLFVPELEAIDSRFIGAYDGTVLHLQALGIAIGFIAGAWSLLRRHAPPVLLACALLAIVTAPSFFHQLQANEADIPVAMMVGLGVAALAAWLLSGEQGLLPAAVLFLVAGALTKNEGEMFVIAAFVAAFAVARRAQRRPLAIALLAAVACVMPWHMWLLAHHVTATTFALSRLAASALPDDALVPRRFGAAPAHRAHPNRFELEPALARRRRERCLRAHPPPHPHRDVRSRLAPPLLWRAPPRVLVFAPVARARSVLLGRPHDRYTRHRRHHPRTGTPRCFAALHSTPSDDNRLSESRLRGELEASLTELTRSSRRA